MDELPAYTPQSLTDLLPIYRPTTASSDHIHSYTLLQTSISTQTLSSAEEDAQTSTSTLHIKSFKTGGFMNRKPHIIISRPTASGTTSSNSNDQQTPVAEARFDIHGTGTSILYRGSRERDGEGERSQRLELEDSRMQILRTTICRIPFWWQPFPGNKDVLELTNEFEDVIARFVHLPSSPFPSTRSPPRSPQLGRERSNSVFSIASNGEGLKKKGKFEETVVGELHVVDALVGGEEEREEILCSAIVVVERTRRRRAILQNKASPYGVARSLGRNGVAYIPQ